MIPQRQFSIWAFIFFPALAMMLGWGLRGHIGGGPFGAMIPGAMVTLSLGILLRLPANFTAVLVVFGIFGIGLGGEMTYGQTLGYLRNPDTVWWGLAGTTLKGSVWGFLGGTILALGFLYHKISRKTILIGLILLLAAFLLGYKSINDPMVLYFSGPEDPRSESWAALLFGAITLLVYYKTKLEMSDFRLIWRFAVYGLIGGGLGFGLGSLWIVAGSNYPDVLFSNWWKAMEFSFGLLLGGALGLAGWRSRVRIGEIAVSYPKESATDSLSISLELVLLSLLVIFIHAIIPYSLEPLMDSLNTTYSDGFWSALLRDIIRLIIGYGFYGLLMILVLMRFPAMAWQIGIALTFSHAAIDLIRDFYPDRNIWSPFTMHFVLATVMTLVVSCLTAYFRRRDNQVFHLFIVLIWVCIVVSLLRLFFLSGPLSVKGMSFAEVVFDRFFVDLYFIVCAGMLSYCIMRFRNDATVLWR